MKRQAGKQASQRRQWNEQRHPRVPADHERAKNHGWQQNEMRIGIGVGRQDAEGEGKPQAPRRRQMPAVCEHDRDRQHMGPEHQQSLREKGAEHDKNRHEEIGPGNPKRHCGHGEHRHQQKIKRQAGVMKRRTERQPKNVFTVPEGREHRVVEHLFVVKPVLPDRHRHPWKCFSHASFREKIGHGGVIIIIGGGFAALVQRE